MRKDTLTRRIQIMEKFFIGNFSRGHVWKSRSEEDECKNKSVFLSLNSCFAIYIRSSLAEEFGLQFYNHLPTHG